MTANPRFKPSKTAFYATWFGFICLLSMMMSSCASAARASAAAPQSVQLKLSSEDAVDGSIVVARLELEGSDSIKSDPTGVFEGIEFSFFKNGSEYIAVFGVPFNLAPGSYPLKVVTEDKNGKKTETLHSISVKDGHYKSEKLNVAEKHVNPPKKVLKRILAEQKEIGGIYRASVREKLWDGKFVLPIDSPVTSPFGTKRMFNGKMKSFHQGLDLKAPIGTPIHAPAGGKVVLAKDLYFTGNTVILDHGFGVFTVYAHMSKLGVKLGQKIAKGDELGISGMTGRASGPHLHWGAVIHRQKVNPMDLTQVMP